MIGESHQCDESDDWKLPVCEVGVSARRYPMRGTRKPCGLVYKVRCPYLLSRALPHAGHRSAGCFAKAD